MASEDRSAHEARIRRLWEEGNSDGAASEALRVYGPEILGLLVSLHRDEDAAADAFSVFAEQLWVSMRRFEYKCSMRTWAYLLARRVSVDVQRVARNRARRERALSDVPEIAAMAARVRTATMTFLRSETKTELAKLRESLPADDQILLVSRLDRGLEWNELALVFLGQNDATADDVKREAARLRKRFQLVKDRLRTLSEERGLLGRG